jgi:hypothetical protein
MLFIKPILGCKLTPFGSFILVILSFTFDFPSNGLLCRYLFYGDGKTVQPVLFQEK